MQPCLHQKQDSEVDKISEQHLGSFSGSRNEDTGICKYSKIYLNIMIKLWMRNGECCVVELLIGSEYSLFPLCAGDEFIS